ncbi:phosphohistidine phosphatase SixA [Geotalea uraniireducens]|uniref:Phosphohistidine phosphatase, SixA n=1 Tax=Geotalea uraniireducens (strain Rf4) TaxID=351605 RepID=A5G4V3_GEOUR|nr:phosphohistidine phosphatase SixA [Geotalea uraniireducens]ABQ26821.1 phosphohistidine phosphatase, SixA [Geotalea uraniireducens Rf4]
MKLYIVRHAAAIERNAEVPEEQRYLTPEGRDLIRKTARTLLQKKVNPDLILTSPLIRAVQTADILAETLSYDGSLQVTDELAPGFGMVALRKVLDAFPTVQELVLVGHEPDLSQVISSLLSLPGGFNLKKGVGVKLVIDPAALQAPATLKWAAVGKKLLKPDEIVIG